MKITLVRHGMPDLPTWDKIYASQMPDWVEAYNSVGVKHPPTQVNKTILNESKHSFFVCSNLPRSIDSAKIIGYPYPQLIDPIFSEAELPIIAIPLLKLLPHTWSIIFRLFWFVGLPFQKVETLSTFKSRVSIATNTLIQLAKSHESVLLMGHGIINRFIAKALISNVWIAEESKHKIKKYDYKYWEFTTFVKI